jgi:hypothetical protein
MMYVQSYLGIDVLLIVASLLDTLITSSSSKKDTPISSDSMSLVGCHLVNNADVQIIVILLWLSLLLRRRQPKSESPFTDYYKADRQMEEACSAA